MNSVNTCNESLKLNSQIFNYCKTFLNETEVNKKQCLDVLRKWLAENLELNAKTDVFNLVRFLRATKFNCTEAQEKIKNFYSLRGNSPEWYQNRDPLLPEMQTLLKIGVFLPLLQRDDEGRMVIVIRIAAHDPYLQKQDDVFKIGLMILDLALDRMEDVSVHGVVAVFDMDGVSYGHARQLTVPMIRKAVHSWQDCYPVRVKGLHFVNSPSYINVVLNIFRKFMREKMRKRVHVHGFDKTSLHKILPKKILPEELGGDAGKLAHLIEHWENEVVKNRSWYAEDEKYKYVQKT